MNISLDLAKSKAFCCDGEVSVDSRPMTVKLIVRDLWKLVEVECEFDTGLNVGPCIVSEFRIGEFMIDFLECHFDNEVGESQ